MVGKLAIDPANLAKASQLLRDQVPQDDNDGIYAGTGKDERLPDSLRDRRGLTQLRPLGHAHGLGQADDELAGFENLVHVLDRIIREAQKGTDPVRRKRELRLTDCTTKLFLRLTHE